VRGAAQRRRIRYPANSCRESAYRPYVYGPAAAASRRLRGRGVKLSVKIPSGGPIIRIGPSRFMAARSAVRDASFFQRLHPVAIGPEVCLSKEVAGRRHADCGLFCCAFRKIRGRIFAHEAVQDCDRRRFRRIPGRESRTNFWQPDAWRRPRSLWVAIAVGGDSDLRSGSSEGIRPSRLCPRLSPQWGEGLRRGRPRRGSPPPAQKNADMRCTAGGLVALGARTCFDPHLAERPANSRRNLLDRHVTPRGFPRGLLLLACLPSYSGFVVLSSVGARRAWPRRMTG
jgi:hypothetical protein